MIHADIGDSYTATTAIYDVINDPVFRDYGRLIFPVDDRYYSGDTLGDLRLAYYSNIDPDETVEITNYMKERAAAGDTIFYDIQKKKRRLIRQKRIPGCSFSRGIPVSDLQSAMRAGRLPMLALYRTAFPMLWNFPNRVITLLP